MSGLRRAVEEFSAGIEPRSDAIDRVLERARRRHIARRVRAGLTGLGLATGVALLAWFALPSGQTDPNGSDVAGPAAVYEGRVIEAAGSDEGIWLLTCTSCDPDPPAMAARAGAIQSFSTTDGQVETGFSISVDAPHAIAADGNDLFFLGFTSGEVRNIDSTTGETRWSLTLGDRDGYPFLPFDAAVSDDFVWISSARGSLAQIDRESGELLSVFDVPPESTGSVAWGHGFVWVAESLAGVLQVGEDGTALDTIAIDGPNEHVLAVGQLAVTSQAVWAVGGWSRPYTDDQGTPGYELVGTYAIAEIDPVTGTVRHVTNLPGPVSMQVVSDQVWLLGSERGAVYQLSGTEVVPVPLELEPTQSVLAVTEAGIWVSDAKAVSIRPIP